MLKKIIAIGVLSLLTACKHHLDEYKPLMTEIEIGLLQDYYMSAKNNKYSDYRMLLKATKQRASKPSSTAVPFCDVARFTVLVKNSSGKLIDQQMNILYGSHWRKCLQDSKYGEYAFSSSVPTVIEEITINTLKSLAKAAKECNIAKVSLIQRGEELTEPEGLKIIKECEVFKLQKELQS